MAGHHYHYASKMESEMEAQKVAIQRKRVEKWIYKTRAQLDAEDPSLRDGLDSHKLKTWRRQITKILTNAGMTLRIPQWGIGVASLLCHRFFARKSMKRNDRYLIATACLHLAAKMEETPKPIREVVKECRKVYLGKQTQQDNKKAPDQLQHEMEQLKEEVLVAERAVLYTLGFNLNAQHPYRYLVHRLTELGLLHANNQQQNNPYKHLMQNTWNFINDSFRTTLCLQYSPELICSAALWLANELCKRTHGQAGDVMNMVHKLQPSATFHSYFQIAQEQQQDIADQILGMYEDVKSMPQVLSLPRFSHQAPQPAPPAPHPGHHHHASMTPPTMPPTPMM